MKAFPLLVVLWLSFSCTAVKETEGACAPGRAFQLAPPQCIADSVLFFHAATMTLELDYPGVAIYYTDDGSAVTPSSRPYSGPIRIDASQTIRARAFHPDLLASEAVSRQFKKVSTAGRNAKVAIHPEAHPSYPGSDPRSLVDLQKGGLSFRNDNRWMGFQADTVGIILSLEEEKAVKAVALSVLEDHGSWIFLPGSAEVLSDGKTLGRQEWPAAVSAAPPGLRFLEIPLAETKTKKLEIRIINRQAIPDWHPGKGTPPWFFIDEILVE